MITQNIFLTEGIISQALELIKWEDGDKIYLDEVYVEKTAQDDLGAYIQINPQHKLYLPLVII